ncbi:xylose isomerase domain protein TIM barrel [Candidatus Vecturithrix granuli]|uniref:Xylose isomerase domain protein TIM barrel n=1 Tax=Vecturithrix granuli TaxID=1499967 RepID=A0A0S6W799_VECG1|nr:xylose isomerase domain protein TIM barrel [Candidatus Vecturithrix granuli]
MYITGIGIDEDMEYLKGSLSYLEENLSFFSTCGFDCVEIAIHQLDVIINGRLQPRRVDNVRAITEKFDFNYTVHAPFRLNLAFPQSWPGHPTDLEHEQDVFAACLDFCAAVGAKVLVYHSGLIALQQTAFGLAPLPTDDELEEACEQEVAALRELMPLAAERGITVAMENRDPHPWEAAILMRSGLPANQLPKYHAGMMVADLIRQVEAVNHPHFGLTIDFGHLFLAANYCGFDYLDALRQAAPYIRHLHGSDNFGRLGGVFSNMYDRVPYGEGDVHLPPGWGEIPHIEALKQLSGYKGLYILEVSPRFHHLLPESVEVIKRIIQEATQPI